LGVLAHHGGMLVNRPELSVGMVRAIARPTGLEVELLARQPLDRRSPTQRQADIRAGRLGPTPAERRLLPAYDEGMDLRVGWLDRDGRARWVYGSSESSSGDNYEGTNGPNIRTRLRLPPLYDEFTLVLAWPEIGFPETLVPLPLPDRATVERGTVSIWEAAPAGTPVDGPLPYAVVGQLPLEPPVEAGRVVAGPLVVARRPDAVVVLDRLTVLDSLLSVELSSLARGALGGAIAASMFRPGPVPLSAEDTGDRIRADGPGASPAVVRDRTAYWIRSHRCMSGGGDHLFQSTGEFMCERPDGDAVDLVVAWPAAGIPDTRVTLTLS
jgi:hypothetical protein